MSRTNKRITKKERNLLKGCIRRTFSRSELREKAVAASRIDHFDPNRPRVTKWSYCAHCGELTPTYKGDVDHKDPVIPVDSSFDDMSLDEVVDRTWCPENQLQFLCESCHDEKTQKENKERRENKKRKKALNE